MNSVLMVFSLTCLSMTLGSVLPCGLSTVKFHPFLIPVSLCMCSSKLIQSFYKITFNAALCKILPGAWICHNKEI
jgi:hypothetical protein